MSRRTRAYNRFSPVLGEPSKPKTKIKSIQIVNSSHYPLRAGLHDQKTCDQCPSRKFSFHKVSPATTDAHAVKPAVHNYPCNHGTSIALPPTIMG